MLQRRHAYSAGAPPRPALLKSETRFRVSAHPLSVRRRAFPSSVVREIPGAAARPFPRVPPLSRTSPRRRRWRRRRRLPALSRVPPPSVDRPGEIRGRLAGSVRRGGPCREDERDGASTGRGPMSRRAATPAERASRLRQMRWAPRKSKTSNTVRHPLRPLGPGRLGETGKASCRRSTGGRSAEHCGSVSLLLTAGLDLQHNLTKINLPTNQKGYDNAKTTAGKLSARRIQIYLDYFCLGIILKDTLNNFQNNAQT